MKLEAVNGNLVSLTVKVPPAAEPDIPIGSEEVEEETHPQPTLSSQEQQKRTKEDGCGDEVEKSVGGAGKKKGTRKKRSTNWEEAERVSTKHKIKNKYLKTK